MAFWGVLVNPAKPYTLRCDGAPKRLRISQATLADRSGIWTTRSVVRCSVGTKSPVYICSLSIKDVDSRQLDLEFEESEDIVFSVSGPRGVHLAGYYVNSSSTTTTNAHKIDIDIEETESENSSHYNSEEDEYDSSDSFIDDSAFQVCPILREPLQSGAMVEEFDNDKKMGHKHVGKQMVSSIEASQQQFIIVERKNEVGEYEAIVQNAQIEEQSDRELINKDEKEDHNHKSNAVVQVGITEADNSMRALGMNRTDSINAVWSEHEGTVPDSDERRDCQTCNSPMQKTEVGPGDAENLKIKKKKRAMEKLVSDYVQSNCHNLAMDYSDSEICKYGGYVSASWTSDEPRDVSAPSDELGLRHGRKLKKKKRKEKVEEFNVLEDNVRNTQNQAISDGNFDIVAMDQYPRRTIMNGFGDDHMDILLKNNRILSIDAGDALTRSHRKLKKKKMKKTMVEEFDNDKKMGHKHVGKQMVSSIEASQPQFIIVERKNEVEEYEAIVQSAQIEEQLDWELVNKDEKENHCHKRDAVVQVGITEGTDSINVVRNEHKGTVPDSVEQVTDFSVPQRKGKRKRRRKRARMKGERIQQISTENDNNYSKMHLDLQVDALDSNSRNPSTDAGNARTGNHTKLRKKKTKKSITKRDKVIVGSTEKNMKGTSWTSDEPHDVSAPSTELGLRHGGKLKKKKRKEKIEEYNVNEDNVRNIQNQAISDGSFDIVAMDQYPRHAIMNGIGDDHCTRQAMDFSFSKWEKLKMMGVGGVTLGETDFDPSVEALESNSKLQHEKILSIDAGDALTRSHSKSKKKKLKKNHNLDSEASQRQYSQYIFKEGKNEVVNNEMIVGSANLEEKSCRKLDDNEDDNHNGLNLNGMIDAIVRGGNVKGIGDHYCDSAINPTEVGTSNGAKKSYNKTVSEGDEDVNKILAGGSDERNQVQKEIVADYDELGVAGKLKKKRKKRKRKKVVTDRSMVPNCVLNNSQNEAVGCCNDDGHLRQVTDFSVLEEKGKLKKKEVEASRIHEKSTESGYSLKIVLALPAILESKSKLQN